MTEAVRRQTSRAFLVVVAAIAVVWAVLLVDLLLQTRWLDVALLLVVTALVVVAYRAQRAGRPFTG